MKQNEALLFCDVLLDACLLLRLFLIQERLLLWYTRALEEFYVPLCSIKHTD